MRPFQVLTSIPGTRGPLAARLATFTLAAASAAGLALGLGASGCSSIPPGGSTADAGIDGPADDGDAVGAADRAGDAGPDAAAPDGGEDAGPGTPDLPCRTALPATLEGSRWDPRFTIAGVAGHDGLVPSVQNLSR